MFQVRQEWLKAIQTRHSRRIYKTGAIERDTLGQLTDFANQINDLAAGVRIIIVNQRADSIFKGLIGSYGKIKNAPAFVAFIGNTKDKNSEEKIGYFGEAFILEATAKNIGTCWVSGTFSPKAVSNFISLNAAERVYAVSPLGYSLATYSIAEKIAMYAVQSHSRKPLNDICADYNVNLPKWVVAGLQAARLAPSAMNRQPWIFDIREDGIKLSTNGALKGSLRLDCGIAMLHFEVGAMCSGVKGRWLYQDNPEVGLFKIDKQGVE